VLISPARVGRVRFAICLLPGGHSGRRLRFNQYCIFLSVHSRGASSSSRRGPFSFIFPPRPSASRCLLARPPIYCPPPPISDPFIFCPRPKMWTNKGRWRLQCPSAYSAGIEQELNSSETTCDKDDRAHRLKKIITGMIWENV
jgi:hypothetical protein